MLLLFLFPVFFLYSIDIKIDAKSAILMNALTGTILYEKNSDKRSYPASLTTVATALYILEKEQLDLTKKITPRGAALLVVNADQKQTNFSAYPSYQLDHDSKILGLKREEELPSWA